MTKADAVVPPSAAAGMPPDFVYLEEVAPGVLQDPRYCGGHNFLGVPVEGYLAPRILLTRRAAEALAAVQAELEPAGLSLKVFDGYRPQRAVDHFLRWAADAADQRCKQRYYPRVDKGELFHLGYLAERSSHSRGSTVDLTLVDTARGDGGELDMGTPFDYFDPLSFPAARELSPQQRANRLLLRTLMGRQGFLPLAEEWWHFTLADEPYPDTWFDFPVR